jgi:mono/diheme cytochrome c family protein
VITPVSPASVLLSFALFALPFAQSTVVAETNREAAKAGAMLFRDKGCTFCHGVGGVGTKKAPDLTGLPADKIWTPTKITNQILNGGQKMPPFRESVTDDEVKDLIAYLRTKNKPIPPPLPEEGAAPAVAGTLGP